MFLKGTPNQYKVHVTRGAAHSKGQIEKDQTFSKY
jgi:hypothetical protein